LRPASVKVDTSSSADLLSADGPFPALLEDFVARDGQQEMAAMVEQALAERSTCVIESGTGTGKTLAYLVPALRSGIKVLISTGTKNLQDQLYHRDLPLVRKALDTPVSAALLKGRANYLCLQRLAMAEAEGLHGAAAAELSTVRAWVSGTRNGDISEVAQIPEESPMWPRVTSTTDNCLGSRCDYYDDCYVNRARQRAMAADLVVVNHHLFFADLVLKEDGFAQLLPGVEAVIFDEAHQLPEVASDFFGISLSAHQLTGLTRDARVAELSEHSMVDGLNNELDGLDKAVADFRLALDDSPDRAPWAGAVERAPVAATLKTLREQLAAVSARLDAASARGEALASCAHRAGDLLDRLDQVTSGEADDMVAWYECTRRGFILRLTPVDISTTFRERRAGDDRAWIYTSATLAINGRFDYFQERMGLEAADTHVWSSPFDYAQQALMYLPPGLPQPQSPQYTARVVDAIVPVLDASRGRAFVLFTSHRALQEAARLLPERIRWPVLVQGSAPRPRLLARFRETDHAVLLATGSFWEGVDVRGEALSCVIIDKLPFASPADPVLQARARAMEAQGRNPFMEYQLPNAVIALKQGAGRLIRGSGDRGILVLCDPRLLEKRYGRFFLDSLPPMQRSREINDVQEFFAQVPA